MQEPVRGRHLLGCLLAMSVDDSQLFGRITERHVRLGRHCQSFADLLITFAPTIRCAVLLTAVCAFLHLRVFHWALFRIVPSPHFEQTGVSCPQCAALWPYFWHFAHRRGSGMYVCTRKSASPIVTVSGSLLPRNATVTTRVGLSTPLIVFSIRCAQTAPVA